MAAPAPVTTGLLRQRLAARAAGLEQALDAVAVTLDPAAVHRSRVLARGLRSLLGTLEPLLRPSIAARLRRDLRRLAGTFQDVREADVRRQWLGAFAGRRGVLPARAGRELVAMMEQSQQAARRDLQARLAAPATRQRRARIARDLRDARLVRDGDDPGKVILRRLRKRWKRLRKTLRDSRDAGPEALHALRLAVKHARYASEDLMPLLGLDPAPASRRQKRLQDCLGEYRDADEALAWLDRLAGPRGPALRGRLRHPVARLKHRRLKELRRLAADFEMPDLDPPPLSRVRRRPAARSARS